MRAVWDQTWGYLVRQKVAPVWAGEFGTPNGHRAGDQSPQSHFTDVNDHNPQGAWFSYLVDYIRELGLSRSIWALNGTQSFAEGRSAGEPEGYGVLDSTWTTVASAPMMARLRTIQVAPESYEVCAGHGHLARGVVGDLVGVGLLTAVVAACAGEGAGAQSTGLTRAAAFVDTEAAVAPADNSVSGCRRPRG